MASLKVANPSRRWWPPSYGRSRRRTTPRLSIGKPAGVPPYMGQGQPPGPVRTNMKMKMRINTEMKMMKLNEHMNI